MRPASCESCCDESLEQAAMRVSLLGGLREFVVGGSWKQTWYRKELSMCRARKGWRVLGRGGGSLALEVGEIGGICA